MSSRLAFNSNGGAVRNYTSVHEVHVEEWNARVWGGMHWRNSIEGGYRGRKRVGKYTATHLMKPPDHQGITPGNHVPGLCCR